MTMMEMDATNIRSLLKDLWNVRVITRGLVKSVYNEEDNSEDLVPGQVLVNIGNEWESDISGSRNVKAWVVVPYGIRPDTQSDQRSQNLEERPFNQYFGFYGMPRIGDNVIVMGFSVGNDSIPIDFVVLGSIFGELVNHPPLTDAEDLQMVHRSGASIRLNDTFEGGGGVSDTSAPEHVGDLTGNLSMVGNRVMMLAGKEYLMHGLVSKYGDPRHTSARIEVFDNTSGKSYDDVFTNDVESNSVFDPFSDTSLGTKKFLRPPSTTDSVLPLSDNTLLLLQQGGGVFRLDDHSDADGYSRLTAGAAGMSFMVGQDYRDLGLKGDSTAPDDGDGEGVTPGVGVYEVNHESGTRISIDADGNVEIILAEGKDITIDDPSGNGEVLLGEGDKHVIRNGDDTTKNAAQDSLPHLGTLGIPHGHTHDGHTHTVVKSQNKVFV